MAITKSKSFKGGAIAGDPTPIPVPADALFIVRFDETPASDIGDALHDKKVPCLFYNGEVVELFHASANSYVFRTTHIRNVDGENILDIVDYVVVGSAWSTRTKEISNGYESQAYLKKVSSPALFDTTGQSGMKTVASVSDVPNDGVYQVSVMLSLTPKTASPTKSDIVFGFYNSDGIGMPDHTFHAVVDDSQTFAQQLSFSTTLNLKAGTNSLKIKCGGLNTEYIVFVDSLTVAQLVNGVYHNGDSFEDVNDLTEASDFNVDDELLVVSPNSTRKMLWTTLANKVLGFIKNLSTTITAFRTGDVIPVDGPSGTAKMSKDDLLRETAENAVESGVAASQSDMDFLLGGDILPEKNVVEDAGTTTIYSVWNADSSFVNGRKYKVVISGMVSSTQAFLRAANSSENLQTIGSWTSDGTYEFTCSVDNAKRVAVANYRNVSSALDFSVRIYNDGEIDKIYTRVSNLESENATQGDDITYLKKAVGDVDVSEEIKTYLEFGVGRITTTTTPDTTRLNWFYSTKILSPKIGDKVKWDGTKCFVGVCVSTGETTVYANTANNSGEFVFNNNYDFAMLTGYTTGANITEDDLEYLDANVYFSQPKVYKSIEERVEDLEEEVAPPTGTLGKTYTAKPTASGNDQSVAPEWLNRNEYPDSLVWGWEYLQHWYEKIYDADENVVVAMSGDSITQGMTPATALQDDFEGMRDWAVKKIMQNGSFPSEHLKVYNCGVGGRTTNEWVGNYHHADLTKWWSKYPNGFLNSDMALNPDLYVLAWGMNDADKTSAYLSALTLEERIALFEQNMREGLGRIRTNTPVVDGNYTRPAYNKTVSDMSIIICLPTCCSSSLSSQGRGYEMFNQYAREVLRPMCREFGCAFADLSNRTYGYTEMTPKIWSIKNLSDNFDGMHPNKWANAQIMSALQGLIYPQCFWNTGAITMDADDQQRYFPNED